MMNEEILAKLIRLESEGKISKEDRERFEEILGLKEENKSILNKVEISEFKSENVLISGDANIKDILFEEGEDLAKIELSGGLTRILPSGTYRNAFHRGFGYVANIHIRLPQTIKQISIKVVSGDVKVKDIRSHLFISSVSGDVDCRNCKGSMDINDVSGDVLVEDFDGEVLLATKSGGIHINKSNFSGALKTYSGDVHLSKCTCSGITITTFSGDTSGSVEFEGDSKISSYFGDISLRTNTEKTRISMEAMIGEVHNNFVDKANDQDKPYSLVLKTRKGDISINNIKEDAYNGR